MGAKRKNYTPKCWQEAARLVVDTGRTTAEVARGGNLTSSGREPWPGRFRGRAALATPSGMRPTFFTSRFTMCPGHRAMTFLCSSRTTPSGMIALYARAGCVHDTPLPSLVA